MPITLGNNSITGLEAGGLPAGSVAAADLSGALSLANTSFSAGRELNYAIVRNNVDTSTSSTSYVDINSANYTPVSSSSHVYVWIHFQLWNGSTGVMNGGDAFSQWQVFGGTYGSRFTFYTNERVAGNFLGQGSVRLHSHFNSMGRFENNDLNTKTIYIQGRYNNSQPSPLSWGHSIQVMYFIKEVLR
jgi:hypothetical protein